MLDVPVGGIRSVYVQLYADLKYVHSFLPIEVVVGNESGEASFEIMKPVLVMTAVTSLPSVPVTFIYMKIRG